jgi:phage replication O-like protein O
MNKDSDFQLERAYTRISNEMLEALYQCKDLKLHEYKLLLCMIRHTNGYNCNERILKNSFLVKETGISKSHICDTIQSLIKRDVIFKKEDSYGIKKESSFWKSNCSVQMEPSSVQGEQKFRPDGTTVPPRRNFDVPQSITAPSVSAPLNTELKKELKKDIYKQGSVYGIKSTFQRKRFEPPKQDEWDQYIRENAGSGG